MIESATDAMWGGELKCGIVFVVGPPKAANKGEKKGETSILKYRIDEIIKTSISGM